PPDGRRLLRSRRGARAVEPFARDPDRIEHVLDRHGPVDHGLFEPFLVVVFDDHGVDDRADRAHVPDELGVHLLTHLLRDVRLRNGFDLGQAADDTGQDDQCALGRLAHLDLAATERHQHRQFAHDPASTSVRTTEISRLAGMASCTRSPDPRMKTKVSSPRGRIRVSTGTSAVLTGCSPLKLVSHGASYHVTLSFFISPPPGCYSSGAAAVVTCIVYPSAAATSRKASRSHGFPGRAGCDTDLRTYCTPCHVNLRAFFLFG